MNSVDSFKVAEPKFFLDHTLSAHSNACSLGVKEQDHVTVSFLWWLQGLYQSVSLSPDKPAYLYLLGCNLDLYQAIIVLFVSQSLYPLLSQLFLSFFLSTVSQPSCFYLRINNYKFSYKGYMSDVCHQYFHQFMITFYFLFLRDSNWISLLDLWYIL